METRRDFIKGALAAGLLAPAIDANAQGNNSRTATPQGTGLSEEQRKTIAQLIEELKGTLTKNEDCLKNLQSGISDIPRDFSNYDQMLTPILVGKHVVFSKEWLPYIKGGKWLTPEQFELWRDNADLVYESLEELIGQTPKRGKKVFVYLPPPLGFSNDQKAIAHAHIHTNVICYKDVVITRRFEEIKHHGCDQTIIHELAHLFANGRPWEAEAETVANLMVAYVLETTGNIRTNYMGAQYRTEMVKNATDSWNRRKFNMDAFAYDDGTVFDFYLFGLVGIVGWATYKKVFRSYNSENSPTNPNNSTGDYKDPNKAVIAREFLERIQQHWGKPKVLKSLPDSGTLFEKHRYFNPQSAK